jgi:RNA recognition motif-containing protein
MFEIFNNSTFTISFISVIVLFVVLAVVFSNKKGVSGSTPEAHDSSSNQVYVGNLSYRVREKHLRELFSSIGGIESLKVIKNHDTGRSKGFGFVTFETNAQLKQSLAYNGDDFEGRSLVVRVARPK